MRVPEHHFIQMPLIQLEAAHFLLQPFGMIL